MPPVHLNFWYQQWKNSHKVATIYYSATQSYLWCIGEKQLLSILFLFINYCWFYLRETADHMRSSAAKVQATPHLHLISTQANQRSRSSPHSSTPRCANCSQNNSHRRSPPPAWAYRTPTNRSWPTGSTSSSTEPRRRTSTTCPPSRHRSRTPTRSSCPSQRSTRSPVPWATFRRGTSTTSPTATVTAVKVGVIWTKQGVKEGVENFLQRCCYGTHVFLLLLTHL